MPADRDHDECGRLDVEKGRYLLRVAGGGIWELESGLWIWWRARRLIGRRVRVQGSRAGYNVLWVYAIEPSAESGG